MKSLENVFVFIKMSPFGEVVLKSTEYSDELPSPCGSWNSSRDVFSKLPKRIPSWSVTLSSRGSVDLSGRAHCWNGVGVGLSSVRGFFVVVGSSSNTMSGNSSSSIGILFGGSVVVVRRVGVGAGRGSGCGDSSSPSSCELIVGLMIDSGLFSPVKQFCETEVPTLSESPNVTLCPLKLMSVRQPWNGDVDAAVCEGIT